MRFVRNIFFNERAQYFHLLTYFTFFFFYLFLTDRRRRQPRQRRDQIVYSVIIGGSKPIASQLRTLLRRHAGVRPVSAGGRHVLSQPKTVQQKRDRGNFWYFIRKTLRRVCSNRFSRNILLRNTRAAGCTRRLLSKGSKNRTYKHVCVIV